MKAPLLSLSTLLAALVLPGAAPQRKAPAVQVWEKPVAPGVTYREEVRTTDKLVIHAVRVSPGAPGIRVVPELAGGTVYEANSDGRGTVSQMAVDRGAIAAVNGDFFPFGKNPTGDPLGLMVRSGELVSTPNPKRAVFAWGPNGAQVGIAQFSGKLQIPGGEPAPIDGLNEDCGHERIVLNTPAAGFAVAQPGSVSIVLKMDNPTYAPSTQVRGTVETVSTDGAKTPVRPGEAILVAQGRKQLALAGLRPGVSVTISLRTTGFDWEKIDCAVGGGPMLLKGGQAAVDSKEEGFDDAFRNTRHPRTAIGRTANGDLWLVVVDGRSEDSGGRSLDDLAGIMRRLGCTDAINLDGGGSSTMNLLGVTVNRPSDGTERRVADGVLVLGPEARPTSEPLRLVANEVDGGFRFQVVDDADRPVPNADVIWSATGSGSIDQGGFLHPLQRGLATVRAAVRGEKLILAVRTALTANSGRDTSQ